MEIGFVCFPYFDAKIFAWESWGIPSGSCNRHLKQKSRTKVQDREQSCHVLHCKLLCCEYFENNLPPGFFGELALNPAPRMLQYLIVNVSILK